MRVCVLGLLLAACSRPYIPFESGHEVHFIAVVEGQARKIQPVVTVGDAVRKMPWRTFKGAAEVAAIYAAPGKHRVSVWDSGNRFGARTTIHLDRDLWIVMVVEPGDRDGRLEVFERPPRGRLENGWLPLVAIPR